MNRKALVYVIVPVYNVKDYLGECLESIMAQTYSNLELVVVDDGSTDGSAEICDQYAKTDARIKVIHQQNMGAAAARKTAVFRAAGEFICFVDADDVIESEMIAFFVNHMGDCDLITSGCYCENAPGQYDERVDAFEAGIYDTQEKLAYFIANMIAFRNRFEDGILPFLVNKMYRAEIMKPVITSIDPSITYAEDRDLLFRYALEAKAIRVTHETYYYYRYRVDSIMRKANGAFMHDLNALYLSLGGVFEKHPYKDALLHQLQLFITSRIYSVSWYMGFAMDTGVITYVFPFSDLDSSSRIVLYGAGRVGVDYYRQIYRRKLVQMVLWVDREWERHSDFYMPVFDPADIQTCEYDYIVIAVKKEILADDIRRELIQSGIEQEKILWRIPAIL